MNSLPCPEPRTDFRVSQCSAFNTLPHEGAFYEWSPHYDEDDPCSLTCKGKPIDFLDDRSDSSPDSSPSSSVFVIAKLADKVQDGTRCREGSLDMCINGACQVVGCDLKLGSKLQVDSCGVCGGDSSCLKPPYHWTLVSMSLCSATCGVGYEMARPVCQNRITGAEVEEELCNLAEKPEATLVECNTHNCPPKWHVGEWGPCSEKCGGGRKTRQVNCVEESNHTKIKVNEYKCTGDKPVSEESCNEVSCSKWHTTQWSGCSVSCGAGIQVRSVECKDENDEPSLLCHPHTKPLSSKECFTGIQCPTQLEESEEDILPGLYHSLPLLQPYPPPSMPHAEKLKGEQMPLDSRFIPEEWSPCSATCGEGIRRREVQCKIYLEFSRTIVRLNDEKCSGPKPPETERCFLQPCTSERIDDIKDDPYRSESSIKVGSSSKGTTYSWKTQGYTHCSATCLGGVQELIVNCVRDDTQKVIAPFLCANEQKPEVLIRTCNDHPCPPRWNYTKFSPCSQSCGIGIQTRDVTCVHEVTQGSGNTVTVPNNMCPQPAPPDRQYCNVLDCPVKWTVSEWSKCSKTCGGGEKVRRVECKQVMAQNHTVERPQSTCGTAKPPDRKPCNTKVCVLDSDKPHIDVSNSTYIQHDTKKNKLHLTIGGAATVFEGTTVKIKCPVKRFNRTKILWLKDNTELPKTKKFKISKKGVLRILNLAYRDNGVYTCVAGNSSANLMLTVKAIPGKFPTSEEVQRHTYKNGVRSDFPGSAMNRDDLNPIFNSDDHSHEQRPDLSRRKTQKSSLFTPTLPSLKVETKSSVQSFQVKEEETKEPFPIPEPSSSSDSLQPEAGGSRSSASRLVPNFQSLITNLQFLLPFQILSSTKTHHILAMTPDDPDTTSLELLHSSEDPSQLQYFGGSEAIILGKGTRENVKFEWLLGRWSRCSQTCGDDGVQMRKVGCVVRLNNSTQRVDNALCEDAGLEIPTTIVRCGVEECPIWVAGGEWSDCEKGVCSGLYTATQTRDVLCQTGNETIDSSGCIGSEMPPRRQRCHAQKCKGKWKSGRWSKCLANCDAEGIKYRMVQCVWPQTNRPAEGGACRHQSRPPQTKPCKGPPCPGDDDCKDRSLFCPNVKHMNMCSMTRYQQQCCQSCSRI